MRLFNRLIGGLQNSDANKENNTSCERKIEGARANKADRKRNMTAKKLGLEALEERQLLSVNPIGPAEYNEIREEYVNLALPANQADINVIAVDKLDAQSVQAAIDQAAKTPQDDLIVLNTTADSYVLNLDATAVTINLDSSEYGKLTIVGGLGENALTVVTQDANAFTVLNGDVVFDGMVLYNFSSVDLQGGLITTTDDANVAYGDSFAMVNEVASTSSSDVKYNIATPNVAGMEIAKASVATAPVYGARFDANVAGTYVQVADRLNAILRRQLDFFGFTPQEYRVTGNTNIYDAECNGMAGWVGTMANMLSYTGWAQRAGFSTRMTLANGTVKNYESVEDAVVDYLRNAFINTSQASATVQEFTVAEMLDYFFSGNDKDCMGRDLSSFTNTVEGGGHFMDVDFQKVGGYVPASDSMILDMAAALRAGNAVTLEVLTTYSTGESKREYVSVWGYTYSPNTDTNINGFQRNNANDVYGLICTNPLAGTYRSDVTYNYYGNNEQNGPYNGTFYYDDDSSAGYNTYHRYLLDAGANSLRLATNPNTVVDENGNLVDSKQLPEGYQYFGKDLTVQNGRTQTSTILGFSWLAQHSKQIPECEMNEGAVLALESMPGNTQNVIFLNFAGAEGTGWDGFEHQRLNLDDAAGYGVAEMQMIEEIWQRVAEDYAPFNVNVTTNPAVWAAAQNGIRCVIGGDYDAAKGGVTGVGTFGAGKPDNYVYPFNLSLSAKNIAEAATHEIGHSLGLGHDGYEHNEYYSGQNSDIWAPIMGTGYSAVMTQWSCGDYVNATNFQDDVAIIASKVGYRVDEHGNTYDQATDLRDFYVDVDLNNYDPNAGTYRVESVIIDRNDVDVFSFTSYGGTYVVDVSGAGADHRFIDNDFNWNTRLHANEENPVFAGKYYASTRNYTNLNLKVSLLDESGNTVLLDKSGAIMKLGYGEKTRAFYGSGAHDSDYHFYVVDQFGNPVYLDDAKTILKEGYYAVDDSYYTTFSHFVTPELEYGKTYYISVTGVGQGSSSTNGYSDYGSIGQYVLSMHESYENFYIDSTKMDVQEMSNSSGVDNVLNWKEAFVYSGRRLEDGSRYLGNTLVFNADLAGTTITLDNTLNFTYSRGIVGQPWAAKRFVLDAMNAWDTVNNRPGITFDAGGKFRTIYVNNTTLEMYGFVITGGTAARGTSSSQVNNGGGVYNNYGWLTIGNSIIAGNTALKAGAGIYNSGGEYEDNGQHDGWLYVIDSEIVGNKLLGGDSVGAAVFNESGAVATLVNVTVAGNTAGYSGGGVQNFGVVNAYNSIIAKNYAAYGADVYTIAGQGLTQVYSTIIGDESRNARLDAYRTGTDSLGDANSKIGNSAGSSVSSPVTVYDPGFVSYRDYDSEDWSQELWKYWNLHLVGDSIAVNIGMNPNFATNLDRTNGRVQASVYNRMGNKRYYVDSSDITTDMAGQNRIEGGTIDAGAFEALAKPDLTEFVPTSAGSDVVNNWENSIVVSRAIDDQTGSVAPFLVDEPLYLNLGFINQGAAITTDFETTVYMWKFDAYTPKAQMYANSTRDNGLPIMNIKVEFPTGAAMPGGTGATITCTNLATGEVQTFNYDGSTSYLLLENVKLDSVQNLVDGLIDNGVISAQNEEGYFLFGYELDSNADLAEYSETNNFYRTSSYFDVVESPVSINDSIVVTTTLDVVDPYDGEISLREAVEVYAGSFYYAEVALQDGDTFEANGVTYRVIDGKFYVDVTSSYQVYPGEQFTINTDVTITATWSDVAGSLVDADNNPITAPNGTIMIKGGVEYVYDQMTGSWLDSEDSAYAFADGETVSWASVESLVITYVTDVFYNGEDKIVNVPNGSVATIDGVEYVLAGDVWVHAEIVAQYTRDDVQAQGSFTMEDGSVVTVVNGVFRREMTDDVAIVPDGSVVQLANGETAVYNFAQDRFVVTEVTTRSLADGDSIEFAGETITLVADSYVDPTNTRFYLAEGTIVTLSNGYTVTYDDGRFVYNTEAVSATKLAAGTTVILNGEEYSYKAGRALVKRVSRESNAVVFADYLDGQTFELTQGPLTLDKTFTLDCIDPLGNILDLTITSHSDNPCLFLVKPEADVTIMNFKFEGAVSEEEGAILENYGELTINNVTFKDNVAKQGNLIYNASDATLNVVGSVFESNTAENSALIFNLGSANISAGTTFTDDYGLRSPIYTSGSLTVDETQFTATSGENGGAILNDGGSVVVARSVFNETSAENKGGAIANIDAADLRVFDSTFSGCFAIDGGAIFNGENGKLTTEATIFQQNNAVGLGGAIYNAGILEEKGSTFEENEAVSGAAIYSEGELKAVGSTFGANVATNAGGAIYSSADSNAAMNIIGAIFIGNVATDGAAVYAGSDAAFSNSLFAKNQATGMGGAVYAAANTTFVNVTIADNNAGEGAGLYNAGTATIDNSILAGNVGAQGNDLYTKEGATTTLRNSLLADIAKVGAGFATDANYRSLLGVAPEFVDPAADDYSLKATSPAINAGSNDLENAETDLAGAARRVGLTIGGVVRTVDMGAFEYQTVVAPDLAIKADTVDYWGAEVIANGATTELGYFIAGQGVCIDFNVQNVGDARVIDNFGFNVKLVGLDAAGNTIYDQTLPTQYYATDFINHNWLNVADWIDVNGEATLMTNFGALPAGYYTVTVTLDVFGVGAVYEYGEEDGFVGENNNVFVGTFNVFSEPSTVVTTDADVVDPVDGETSLREAIQAAGDYVYVSTTLVADGTTFTLENGEVLTVVDGWLTQSVDVVVKDGVQYDLQEGDEFILNGRSIYYHYQMNGGYFTYGVDPDSARVSQEALNNGPITYPDGSSASFSLQTAQYIHYVDETDLNPQEGAHYTYNVLKTSEGDVVLQDGMEFNISNVKFTYRQNETYPQGAFLFEDGTLVEYEDGGVLNFASLAIGSLSTRNARVEKAVILADGSTLEVKNGVAKIYKEIDSNVTFDKAKMQNKTIVVDPAKGPVVLDKTTTLIGSSVVIDRELAILGEDRNVSVSGNDATNMFLVNTDTVATISDLTMTKGYAKVGGAIYNKGDLNLANVDFVDNEAYWVKSTTGGEHLTEGLGGAIYNVGKLAVDGGSFQGNAATDFGGAIFADTEGETVVKNATFQENSAFAGGAIVAQNGGLTIENTTFASNTAQRAGAIYTLVNATIVASSFVDNSAVAADYSSRNVVGGAIYASKEAKLTFAADIASGSNVAATFEGNTAEAGGAIYAEAGFNVEGDLIARNNSAVASQYVEEVKGDYGAIFANGHVNVAGNLEMTGNAADGSYGAIYANGKLTVELNANLSNNAAKNGSYGAAMAKGVEIKGDATFNNNAASGSYGALYSKGALNVEGDLTANGNVAGENYGAIYANNVVVGGNATFNDNAAGADSGALYANGSLNVGGDLVASGNSATGEYGALAVQGDVDVQGALNASNNTAAKFAGLYAKGDVNVGANATISGNQAVENNAGLFAEGQFLVEGDLEANNNTAAQVAAVQASYVKVGGNAVVNGNVDASETGAIVSGSNIDVVGNATALNNEGGAFNAAGNVVIGGNADFENNTADHGAAIRANDVLIEGDVVLKGNISEFNGGAVDARSFETKGALTATGNVAGERGGAINSATYVKIGVGSSNISGNSAGENGGAIYAIDSVVIGGDAVIASNTAATLPVNVESTTTETIGDEGETIKTTITKTTFSSLGGAIYVAAGGAEFGGSVKFNKNKAGVAGALYAKGGVEVAGDASFANNTADAYIYTEKVVEITPAAGGEPTVTTETTTEPIGDYGAAYVEGALSVGGVLEVAGNQANRNYGAIYVAGNLDVVGNATFSGNTAGGSYGAAQIVGTLNIGGALNVENNAANAGDFGALAVGSNVVVTGDAVLKSNVATGSYGALYAAKSVSFGSLEAANNEAGENYGAIYVGTTATINKTAMISGNQAGGNFGGMYVKSALAVNNVVEAGAEPVENALTLAGNEAAGNIAALFVGSTLTVNGSATIDANVAGGDFGALRANQAVSILGDLNVTNNVAGGSYGALYVGKGLTVQGDVAFSGNEAQTGSYGAAYVYGAFAANSLTATGNQAGGDVGALYVGNAIDVAGDLNIENNVAGGDVGAIRTTSAITVGGNALVSSNSAGGDVGAIRAGVFKTTNADANVVISDNQAGGNVGAMQLLKSRYAMDIAGSVVITGNRAGLNEVVVETEETNGAVVTKTVSTSKVGKYGAIAVSAGFITIGGDATITDNSAAAYGAIYVKNAIEIGGALTMSRNTADGKTTVQTTVETTVENFDENGVLVGTTTSTETSESVSYYGANYGAAYVGSNFIVNGDSTIANNSANDSFGAIYAAMSVTGGSLTLVDNVAGTSVGGIATQSNMTVNGALVATGNRADNVAAIAVAGTLTVNGDATIANNAATTNAGVVAKTTTVTGNLVIDANVAESGHALASTTVAVQGDLTVTNNVNANIWAGTLTVAGDAALESNRGLDGAAIYATNVTVEGSAKILANVASNGGAIYATNVDLNNALIAGNSAVKGGAISAENIRLVNATVAGNTAVKGGALYIGGVAKIDNSIVAGNSVVGIEATEENEAVAGEGADIYAVEGATVVLRNSLLQNAEDTGEVAFSEDWLVAEYRSFVNVDPMFADAANGDYSLTANSPAVNTGSNALAKAGVAEDLAGNPRYVGVEVDGVVYAIDMGAFEFQTVVSANLGFGENPINFWFATVDGEKTDHYIVGNDVVLDFEILNSGETSVFDKFNVTYVVTGTLADGSEYNATVTTRYQADSDYFDWLKNADWFAAGSTQTYARQNLGALPVGSYTIAISLDGANEIVEVDKENNVYTTAFDVYEAPSLVVNTEEDGAFNPLDDKITLREASELYVGSYWYASDILVDSGEFIREDMKVVKVEDGVATVGRNVYVIDEVETTAVDGAQVAYGETYVVFDNGVFTYPDGTTQAYAPGKFDYDYSIDLVLADGSKAVAHRESKFDYLESIGVDAPVSTKYEYVDVVLFADGSKILFSELEADSIVYDQTYMTYRDNIATDSEGAAVVLANGQKVVYNGVEGQFMNGGFIADDASVKTLLTAGDEIQIEGVAVEFVGPAFVLGDGSFVPFVDGSSFATETGLVVETAIRRDAFDAEFVAADGLKYQFANDGTARVSTFVGSDIVFAEGVENITLAGTAITPAKSQTITADANVTISGNEQSNVFVVNYGLDVDMTNLTLVDGLALKGGAIYNAGALVLNNVDVENSFAYTELTVDPQDKVLNDGLGGAIYNSGSLTINEGDFLNNAAQYFGGAIYSIGALNVDKANFVGNESNYFGGAVYVQNSNASFANSKFENNVAKFNGGAIAAAATNADSKVTIVNSLMANNRSKEAEGGAIYAIGQSEKTMEVEATNVTIADNRAALGGGVAVDSASLILKNSILAGNDASYQADDLAIEGTATVVLYASLLGNGEDVVNADALSVAEGHAAFIGTNANPIDPKFGENYALTSASPAVNSGVNSFIEGQEYDLAGNDRILGDYVDLGAYELAFVAPDLAFDTDWALKGWHASADGLDLGKFVEGWDVAFDYKFGNYGSGIALNSFDYTITVVRLDAEGNPVEGSERVFTRTYGDDVDGFMSEEYWLNPNATVSGYWNLGAFDAGQYQATISLDVNNTVYETSDENNAYVVTFDVAERPSLVVTTELDVVDEFDGLVSLREAISAIGTESTESISMKKQLVEGATFELANGVVATYAEGKLTYADEEGATVELIANTPYELANGEELVWDGADLVVLTSSIADTITFAENVNGKTITLVDGELVIDRDMTISASVEQNIAIDAQNASRILFVAHGDVRVGGLTLLNANATMGAAVYNAGVLALNDMTINTANAEQGAGVYNAAGASLDLWNVSFADMNATDKGGAVYNAGDLVANLATFSESDANEGAAIYNAGNATINQSNFSGGVAANMAGAIYNAAGVLNVSGSNFANNSAEYGGAIVNYQGSATIVETIFEGNSARKDAGAIDNYGALKLAGVSFKGNSATGFGGAIYNSASSATAPYVVTLDSVVFSANNANEKGGAIYNATNSQVVSENGTVKFQYNDSKNGGAIYNVGAVTAKSAWTFDGNRASENGAALYNAGAASFAKVDFVSNAATVNGGAVYNVGAFKANYANFQANKATGSGAALYNANGTTAVSNGLFWLNVASVDGGAIYNAAGTTTLRNATIAANAATNLGGGVYNAGTLKAYNTIIADNNAANAVDLYATNAKAALYNSLVGSLVGSKATPTMNASVVGEAGFKVAPVFVDGKVVNEVDLTLLATSAGVNSGKTAYALDTDGNALVYDLAGEDRVCSTLDAVDMGAFEFPYEEPASVVNTNLDVVDPTDGVISLREALAYAQRIGSNTITFDPSVKNVVLNSTLYVDSDITIEGGADIVTFESNFDGSLVVVGSENEDANVAFRRVAFTGATNGVGSDNPDNAGGAICNYANLSLEFVSVSNNAAAYGGGLYNAGTISIVDSEIVNNSATYYGGVYNRGDMTINRTTIAGNSATYYGGGIGTYTGATIANTAIYGNSASLGGGVYSQVNMADLFTSDASFDLNMTNVTIVGNVATGETSSSVGGGVWVNHVLNLTNSIVYGNVGSLNADLYATTILATSKTTMTNSNVGAANIAISGQGVKSVDPKFIQFDANTEWTKWDLNLQIGSPMINAGRNADVVGEYDVLRNARIVGSAVDMGAFEEQGNIAPTDINIELETIDSSSAAGSLVATLEAVDPNDGDTFVYELTDDADGAFAISGNEIVLAKNLEAGEYSFTVRATDSGEASIEKTFDIVVYATEAPSYGAPAVDSLGRNVNGEIAVQWSSTDPAKEYVVEYRVKGDSAWTASAALTGNVGVINDAFENGSIVQVRIKALASSQKNESEWSEVAEYMIQKAPEAVKVETTQSGEVVMFNVVSNTAPRAYWKIDWNDGSEPTIVTGLAMSRNFSHWYAESGTYAPTLYLDNDTEGVVLDTVVVEVAGSSDAVLDVENVFSELDPVAVDAAAILNAKSEFVWNAIPQTVSVDAAPIAVVGGASANAQAAAVVDDESREAAFADLAEVASDDYELDSAVESIFDEAFVNDLFEF